MTKTTEPKPDPSKRKLIAGRWQDPDAAKKSRQRAEKTVSVKMTEAELAEFDGQISVLGIKRNRALRIAARRIGGFLEVDAEVVAELKSVNRQLSGIATNVNQIAHSANRTHDPDYRAFMAERADLGRELFRLKADLQQILNLAARREDGLTRLEVAAGS